MAAMKRTGPLVVGTAGLGVPMHAAGLLADIAAQAGDADRTRSISAPVIASIKRSDLVVLSATKSLGGVEASISQMAAELAAIAAACASTAWCLWNHLCVFHLFCGALGPDHHDLLAGIVERHEWVCFPGGAGSRVHARAEADRLVLNGPTAFGSGSRYAEWAGCAFAVADPATGKAANPPDLRFSIIRLDSPGVGIEPTWDGASLRATATDDVIYSDAAVPADRWSRWYAATRAEVLRDPATPVIDHRYREDWVGLSDLWLAAMAVGLTGAALEETVEEIGGRRALMGRPMVEMAGVHFNVGRAADAVAAAGAIVTQGCAEVDARIDALVIPTEDDYLRQLSLSATVLSLCETAMGHLRKTLGGNGLRESHRFERRQRDFAAMPIHINAHEDRVAERVGRHLLGVEQKLF